MFQISFTHYENILAHITALVTSGNSGLPRLNFSRKSSDIPLPTQSPIWVNHMGPITPSFGKKCHNVTTPGDNLQIRSTKRAFIGYTFLPHRFRSLHQGYFPDLIDQHDQHSVPTGIHVNETRSQRDQFAECMCRLHAVLTARCGPINVRKINNITRPMKNVYIDHIYHKWHRKTYSSWITDTDQSQSYLYRVSVGISLERSLLTYAVAFQRPDSWLRNSHDSQIPIGIAASGSRDW